MALKAGVLPGPASACSAGFQASGPDHFPIGNPPPRRTSERIIRVSSAVQRNPHFDDDRVIWNDAFSGEYYPVRYQEQFDEQWKLFLKRKLGFHQHTGVETSNEYIDDR